MTNPIVTKPNTGSVIAIERDKDMIVNPDYQRFFDDVEQGLNFPALPVFTVQDLNTVVSPALIPVLPASANIGVQVMVSDETGGIVPAFSDASPVSTIFSITSVTNVSSVAQFNFTPGPTLEVNQQVIVSGFVVPGNAAYNATHIISVVGAGFFRISSIAFAGSETVGKFILGSNWRRGTDRKIIS